MSDFVHLHCHSEYSLLDGAIRIKDLAARAKDFGMPAAAVTDHGNMYGAAYFYKACKEIGIKPVIGCEVYLTQDHRDTTSDIARSRGLHHLILLAADREGYHNLVKLVTRGWLEGFYYNPRVDKKLLKEYSKGLIALSACIGGEIPCTLLGRNRMIPGGGDMDAAIALAREYAAIYPDRFYLEVQANTLPEQHKANTALYELAAHTGLPLVATNDCHYLEAADAEVHDVLLCIQAQKKISDKERLRFDAKDLYYKSTEEMEQAFAEAPQAVANTLRIAEACDLDLNLKKAHYFPVYSLPENITPEQEFQRLSREGLKRRLSQHPDRATIDAAIYEERLEKELKVICDTGFPGYFLVVQDLMRWARENSISVGPGRGSGVGSLVAWALRITNVDPLPYNLLFERFLNSERVSPPDIDLDFCEERRSEVIGYATKKYGQDCVAQITTFGAMKAKAVVRDVGRALDMPLKEADRIAKLVPAKDPDYVRVASLAPEESKMTLSRALEIVPELADLYKNEEQVRKLIDISMRLEGLVRHASTHASGVVISDRPMVEYLPMYKPPSKVKKDEKDELVTQYDYKMVEEVGLVKFDILGLRNVTLLRKALEAIAGQGKTPPDLDTLPLDDAATYELYSRGDTDGVFQCESGGMRQYLRMLKPSCFKDIIAMIALYRPGPLRSGMVNEFIKRKNGEAAFDHLLPQLEDCLKDTYGVIVYQEQVMQIAQIVGGYTLGGADLLRRAMGKKNLEAMAKERPRFVQGAEAKHIPAKKAHDIFSLMEKFAEYGFNKSHSAAYALVSYHTAYLKAHFPVAFMCALLTSERGDQDKILKYITVCKDMGIEVRPPDVQYSKLEFTVQNESIIFGLGGIKNVGDEAIKEIVHVRENGGPFASFLDMCVRVSLRKVTKRALESLIKSGACDCFGCPRAALFAALDVTVARAQKKLKEKQSGQASLLGMMPVKEESLQAGIGFSCEEQNVPEWDEDQKSRFEKEALGFFLSHPLQQYRQEIIRLNLKPLEAAREMPPNSVIRTAVLVTDMREITIRTGKRMAFVTVEDLTATGEAAFFEEQLLPALTLLKSGQALLLTATIDSRSNGNAPSADTAGMSASPASEEDEEEALRAIRLRAMSVEALADVCLKSDAPCCLELELPALASPALEELKGILERHRGRAQTHLAFRLHDVRCVMRLGPRWTISPTPVFHQEVRRWHQAVCAQT